MQQILPEIPRRRLRRPRRRRLLVGAEQQPAAFLPGVDLAGEVDGVDDLLAGRAVDLGDLRHVLGQDVVVLHREHRQLEPDHAADLARPEAAGIDHVLGADRALLGHDVPRAVGIRDELGHAIVEHDLGAGDPRRFRVGVRRAVRIEVALDRVPHRADEVFFVDQRQHLLRLRDVDDLRLHAEIAAARMRHLQPVEALRRVGELQPAGQMQPAGFAGDRLDLLVEPDRIGLQLGDVRVGVQRVEAAGGVPGRAGGELRAARSASRLSSRPWSGGRAPSSRRRRRRSPRPGHGISWVRSSSKNWMHQSGGRDAFDLEQPLFVEDAGDDCRQPDRAARPSTS